MDKMKLDAKKRNVLGKKTRFLRREGITPTHLFGHDIKSQALECDTARLQKIITDAGMTKLINLKVDGEKTPKSVFIREIQRNPVSRQLLHVDFYQIKKGEKITVTVPIVIVGEAPALKGKGRMLAHGLTSLRIECLPEKIPAAIEVDISGLEEVEQPIQVRNIVLDPDITVHADPEQLVVKVSEAIVKEVIEEAPAEEAEMAEAAAEAEEEAGEETAGGKESEG
ncbi:50S ribosomal protein L25 [Chloroflexota bacterium]